MLKIVDGHELKSFNHCLIIEYKGEKTQPLYIANQNTDERYEWEILTKLKSKIDEDIYSGRVFVVVNFNSIDSNSSESLTINVNEIREISIRSLIQYNPKQEQR